MFHVVTMTGKISFQNLLFVYIQCKFNSKGFPSQGHRLKKPTTTHNNKLRKSTEPIDVNVRISSCRKLCGYSEPVLNREGPIVTGKMGL